MNYPEYLKSEVEQLRNCLGQHKDEFMQKERKWVHGNLSLLCSRYNVLDVKLKVNPYMKIVDYRDADKVKYNLIIPKFLALQEIVIYWWVLDGVDLFIRSLYNYGESVTGREIVELSCGNDSNFDRIRLEERLNIVIRKFLSYQYLVID